jgi:DNA-binding CsgD family transcriptional regulator
VGRTTPFGELPAAQDRLADRTLLTALLAWRTTGLVTGAAALIAGRARYRSGGLAVAQLALAAGESAAGAPDDVIDALAAGAAGYLTKDADARDIQLAVRAVASGETYVSPTLASYLISANRQRAPSLEHQLSPRELEILALVAAGETDRDIAKQLFIATTTVYSHLERIRDKTGARRRAQLTRLYLERKKPSPGAAPGDAESRDVTSEK